MEKPAPIVEIEKQSGKFFSSLTLQKTKNDTPKKLKEKKFTPIYSERILNINNKIEIQKYILKSVQGFYLCFERNAEDDFWETNIYFEETQESELQFFINNFIKKIQNATT
jgi:hypothetical protein